MTPAGELSGGRVSDLLRSETARPEFTWPDLLTELLAGSDLSQAQTAWVMDQVMSGAASEARLAAFLIALRAKGESVQELSGLAGGMIEHAHRLNVPGPTIDIVGTGGDRSMTVNISSMSAIVMAGAGAVVVKHGNRAASSKSGSADMLEALGIRLDLTPEQVGEVARQAGITFCFAASFHPSFRHAAAVRRDLGIATAFNFLGPLTNPAQPRYAAVGCADARMAPLMAGVFASRGTQAVIFRGDDGLDEITPATTTSIWWAGAGAAGVSCWTLDPARLDIPRHSVADLRGGDGAENADVTRRLLDGESGPVRDTVLLNAGTALALLTAGESGAHPGNAEGLHTLVRAGMEQAERAIDDGRAAAVVDRWTAAAGRAAS